MSDFLSSFFNLFWENSRHLATLPLVSTSPVTPYWWCISITTQIWVVDLMVVPRREFSSTSQRHYPDLGSYTSPVRNFCALFSEKQTNNNSNWETSCGVAECRFFPLRLTSTGHFMFDRMHLLTVAGEATARSWTSNNMCMVLLSLILSLLARQSILLSSKTVFMFSIHRASTGPSHTIHLWSSVVSWAETVKNGHYGV